MRLLLDAHTLIWHKDGDAKLPESLSAMLEDAGNELVISAGTFWEMGLKESLGKLKIDGGVASLYEEWVHSGVASWLPVEWAHLRQNFQLPWIHRDPFDRLLVAQALVENLALVSHDPHIRQYPGVQVIWQS